MRKIITCILFLISIQANAQLDVGKLFGKNSKEFYPGFGGFLKLSYAISEANYITSEVGALFFLEKTDPDFGWAVIPLKAGFRHTLNGSGLGFYVEPQVGYNFFGVNPDDEKFTGFVWAAGGGYMFQPLGKLKFDLGLRYESALYKGGSINYFAIRFSHNITFGKGLD